MSREAYQVPTLDLSTGNNDSAPARSQPTSIPYICGDCGLKSASHQTFPFLRCITCGCRILYKERTKRYGAVSHHGCSYVQC